MASSGAKEYIALLIATFSLQRGYTPEQADQLMEAFLVTEISSEPSRIMQILINICTRLELEPEDEWGPKSPNCGVRNLRTGMVCNVPPHASQKHWTVTADGERYDWFETGWR